MRNAMKLLMVSLVVFALAVPVLAADPAPAKPAATRVKVPPVELDCSRPKAASGKKLRGRTRKHDAV